MNHIRAPKVTALILLVFGLLHSNCPGQAPDSIAGFVYRDSMHGTTPFDGEGRQSLEFRNDGTFVTRVMIMDDPFKLEFSYIAPSGGSYTYTRSTSNQATIALNFDQGVPEDLTLSFSGDSGGTMHVLPGNLDGTFFLSPVAAAGTPRAVVNVSTLAYSKQGMPTMVGFVVGGTQTREFLIRVVGPTLDSFGIKNTAAAPTYELHTAGDSSIYQPPGAQASSYPSTNGVAWSAFSANASTVVAENLRAGAFALIQGSNDKADVVLLEPGAYTIVINPKNSSAEGYQLVEVYEVQ